MGVYAIKIFKSYGGRVADNVWSNTYHWSNSLGLEDNAWLATVNGLVALESRLHLNTVNFLRAVVSTTGDEEGYDPSQLRVFELQGAGLDVLPAGEKPLDLNFTLKMKKQVIYGRAGTMFYRGALHTGHVEMGPGGKMVLTAGAAASITQEMLPLFTDILGAAVAASNGGGWVMGPPANLANNAQYNARPVSGLQPSGVSLNKRNHRYFDTARSDDGIGPGT